ncbi:hypothetical protein MMOR_01470 [Mycolicibacterium moriokaense]|uniref:Alpha/beta hydrolase family protein n=1 Tax=Mycolicibacterium moriokaense TaxID=39691 RepID=A0AAD1H6J8_9MYCO|nr:hypothetical protein MMOR_01470 [Mycolicibacterium moriokaense]
MTGSNARGDVVEMTRRLRIEMPRHVGPLLDVMAVYSVEQGLPNVAPLAVTVLWGTDDRISPRWHSDVVAGALGARLDVLAGVGHMVNWPQAIFDAIVSAPPTGNECPR